MPRVETQRGKNLEKRNSIHENVNKIVTLKWRISQTRQKQASSSDKCKRNFAAIQTLQEQLGTGHWQNGCKNAKRPACYYWSRISFSSVNPLKNWNKYVYERPLFASLWAAHPWFWPKSLEFKEIFNAVEAKRTFYAVNAETLATTCEHTHEEAWRTLRQAGL